MGLNIMQYKNILYTLLFLFVVLVLIPVLIVAGERWDLYYTLSSVALLAIASAGVWLTFYIGRINIGQGAFALVGGYATAILITKAGFSFWLALPLSGCFAAMVSILIGLPILRLRGVYFAMITLVLTEVGRLTALALPITNGAKGINNIPLPGAIKIAGLTLIPDFAHFENPRVAFYYLATVLMIICFAVLYRLTHSRLGHLCRSMQQNEELTSSIGVNIAAIRIIIFAVSSFMGGIGGSIFAVMSQSIYPSSFQVADSINFMLNCFLGGLGYVFGPMLGTVVLYFGWDLLFQTGKYQMLIYSSLLILTMLVLPNGLLSLRFPRRSRT